MTKRIGAGEVGDRNIAMAADTRPPTHPVGIFEDGTTLYMPPLPTRTEEEREAAERIERELSLDASRSVARFLMLRAHGCKGKGCRKRSHAADLAWMRTVLAMLFQREAPETTGLPP